MMALGINSCILWPGIFSHYTRNCRASERLFRSRSAVLQKRQVSRRIDIEQNASIQRFVTNELSGVTGQKCPGSCIARKFEQVVAKASSKTHGVPTLSFKKRSGELRAARNERGERLDGRRVDARHVRQRDDPTIGCRRRTDPARKTRSHAVGSVGAQHNLRTFPSQHLGNFRIAWTNDSHGSVDREQQTTRRQSAHTQIVVQELQQLPAAKPACGTGRKKYSGNQVTARTLDSPERLRKQY